MFSLFSLATVYFLICPSPLLLAIIPHYHQWVEYLLSTAQEYHESTFGHSWIRKFSTSCIVYNVLNCYHELLTFNSIRKGCNCRYLFDTIQIKCCPVAWKLYLIIIIIVSFMFNINNLSQGNLLCIHFLLITILKVTFSVLLLFCIVPLIIKLSPPVKSGDVCSKLNHRVVLSPNKLVSNQRKGYNS